MSRTLKLPLIFVTVLGVDAAVPATSHADHIQTCLGRNHIVPDRLSVVCSGTWQFTGICTGSDMWDQWKVTGTQPSKDAFVRPSVSRPIIVVGYELVKLAGAKESWFMLGSTIQSDAMLWLAPGENHAKVIWPPGLGQPWPSADDADQTGHKDMLDLHGWCPKGDSANIMLTVYYTPEWESQTPAGNAPRKP
jgi:hypothetical protein